MNIKGLIIAGIGLGLLLLTSCSGGYTCPTYAKDTQNSNQGMVKEIPSNSEVNS